MMWNVGFGNNHENAQPPNFLFLSKLLSSPIDLEKVFVTNLFFISDTFEGFVLSPIFFVQFS